MNADATQVLIQRSSAAVPPTLNQACLVHIYPAGPQMGSRFCLASESIIVGRDFDCQIRLDDGSVSRRHAIIQSEGNEHAVIDLQSTNGTFVNGWRVERRRLKDGDYLHTGNIICRYLAGGNVEAQYHEEIRRLTAIDPLTDVQNRRSLIETLGHELANAARYRRPLAFALFDVDHFKSINDEFGHLCGDFTLRELTREIKLVIRQQDTLGRYGGEEFGIVLPDTHPHEAMATIERLRLHVESHRFRYEDQMFSVTISAGLSAISGEDWITTHEVIHQADDFLRRAKEHGRNRVCGPGSF
jgi:diguanylate cyclase (GGDEF)-like protein